MLGVWREMVSCKESLNHYSSSQDLQAPSVLLYCEFVLCMSFFLLRTYFPHWLVCYAQEWHALGTTHISIMLLCNNAWVNFVFLCTYIHMNV